MVMMVMVECSLMVTGEWAIGSILDGGLIEILYFSSSQCCMTGVTKAMLCTILSVGWCI